MLKITCDPPLNSVVPVQPEWKPGEWWVVEWKGWPGEMVRLLGEGNKVLTVHGWEGANLKDYILIRPVKEIIFKS